MSDRHTVPEPRGDHLQHEPNRIATTAVVLTVAGLLLLVGVALALVSGVITVLVAETPERTPSSEINLRAQPSTGPQLNPEQYLQLKQLRAQEDRVLQEYKWLDRERGVAQIPIRRAMAILAERKFGAESKTAENRDAK